MPSWDDLNWESYEEVWRQIDNVPEVPGAYAVRCAPGGKPRSIGRVFRPDPSGILFFGSTERLKGRLTNLCRALQGMRAPHVEGRRYRDLRYMDNGFPLSALQIAWKECTTPEEAKQQESAWFDEYMDEYGELPPLNRQGG